MISMDKKYQTLDGRDVELVTITGRGKWCVLGYISTNSFPDAWNMKGEVYNHRPEFRIVEVKSKIKYLKPLHQLLIEYPNYEIWNNGDIDLEPCRGHRIGITPDMLRYLGKPYADRNTKYTWNEFWIEEREG